MKIERSMAQQAYAAASGGAGPARIGGAAPQGAAAPAARPQQPDSVALSAQSRQSAQALAAVRAAPAVRADLVAALRTQVQSGTYPLDSGQLAAAIARRVDVRA